MKIAKQRLDRRHSGFHAWKYFIKFPYDCDKTHRHNFFTVREWCWSLWGPSKELDEWLQDTNNLNACSQNEFWCWQNDRYNTRIYLRTDKELSQLALVWL